MPIRYRNYDVLNLIKSQAELTVFLRISKVSENRPELYPGTTNNYPSHEHKGKYKLRNGSGIVCKVVSYAEKDNKTCQCAECKTSTTPRKAWGEINVFTATHVVYDEAERKHTQVFFFRDSEQVDKTQGVSISAEELVRLNVEKDWCRINCYTHNDTLLQRLDKGLKSFERYCQIVEDRYKLARGSHRLTVIVSHPHGGYKKVSIGQWRDKTRKGQFGDHRYTYDTVTCPGSSGAYVYILGGGKQSYDYLHKGCNEHGFNFSTEGWESL